MRRIDKADFKKQHNFETELEVNQNYVILRFIGFDLDPDEITNNLGLKPSSIAKQGEDYYLGKSKVKKTWEFNHWEYEIKTETNNFIGETITNFFKTIIEPRLNKIKEISSKSRITRLIVVQYYYTNCNPGYAFEKEQVKILSDINAEIDIDIYCLSED